MSRQTRSLSSPMRWLVSASVAVSVGFGSASTTWAAEIRTGDSVVIAADETVSDDVYAFGNAVTVQGTVDGDVIAAGTNVTIAGHVTGDVMAAGTNIMMNGPVDGSVRTAGNLVSIAAPVSNDALMAGSMLTLTGAGSVGRDLLAGGNSLTVHGPVGGDLTFGGGSLTVSSTVGGALEAEVSDLTLDGSAVVGGPVTYVSAREAAIAPAARVEGPVQHTPSTPRAAQPWEVGGFDLLGLLRGFVGLAALGTVFALVFPRTTSTVGETVQQRWLGSLGLGFALLVGIPILALVLFVIGLMVGGWWIGLMVLGAYALLAVLGYLSAAEWAGLAVARLGKWQVHPAWSLLLGLAVLGLLTLIPVVGGVIGFVAMVIGVGALGLAAWQAYRGAPPAAELAPVEPAPTPLGVAA
jgi:cytoskeletal protein CcmA (bactofilin family)